MTETVTTYDPNRGARQYVHTDPTTGRLQVPDTHQRCDSCRIRLVPAGIHTCGACRS